MKIPLQTTFRNMPNSTAIETKIHEKSAKLDRFYDRIMSCRVVVEELQRRHHQGNIYSVHIDITVPGKELAISEILDPTGRLGMNCLKIGGTSVPKAAQ